MSKWNEIEFEFELSDGQRVMIGLSTYATGNYEEPMLEPDGDIMIRTLASDVWETLGEAKLSAEDRLKIENAVERELDRLTDDYSSEIGQSLAESAADRLFDSWEDR